MRYISISGNYPLWIVLISNLFSFALYGLGYFIMSHIGWLFALAYLIFVFVLEYRVIRYHCIDCYYWGKVCGFGKGVISSFFFKKGDIRDFCSVKLTWKAMIPDLLISLIPLTTGIVLLIIEFKVMLLVGMLLLVLFTTLGNSFIRGSLTCKYCKQREIGCPADKLFNVDAPDQNVINN